MCLKGNLFLYIYIYIYIYITLKKEIQIKVCIKKDSILLLQNRYKTSIYNHEHYKSTTDSLHNHWMKMFFIDKRPNVVIQTMKIKILVWMICEMLYIFKIKYLNFWNEII